MMTKQSSSTLMLFKKISTFPVVAAIVFFCSATVEKAVAQEPEKVTIVEVTMKDLGKPNNKEVLIKKDTSKPKVTEVIMKEIDPASSETGTHKKQVIGLENILNNSSDTTKEPGLTDEQMQEYKSIINSYNINLSHETFSKFSDALKSKDCIRLRALYNAMNMKQKMSQNLIFFNMGEVVKKIPEATTYESFKDSSKYQVYINGEKVPSSDLNKYKSSDFDNYTIFESNNPVNIGKSTVRLRTSKMGEKSGMAYVIFTGVNAVNIKFDKASFL